MIVPTVSQETTHLIPTTLTGVLKRMTGLMEVEDTVERVWNQLLQRSSTSSWAHPEGSRCAEIERHCLQVVFGKDTMSTFLWDLKRFCPPREAHTRLPSILRVAGRGRIPELYGQRNLTSLATLSRHVLDWRVAESNLCWILSFRDDNDIPRFKRHPCSGESDPLQGRRPGNRKV